MYDVLLLLLLRFGGRCSRIDHYIGCRLQIAKATNTLIPTNMIQLFSRVNALPILNDAFLFFFVILRKVGCGFLVEGSDTVEMKIRLYDQKYLG
jgi:hypothetical protein